MQRTLSLESYECRTPMEKFDKALNKKSVATQKRYRRQFAEFLDYYNTTTDNLIDFYKKAIAQEKQEAMTDYYEEFRQWLISDERPDIGSNTAIGYLSGVNLFFKVNNLPKLYQDWNLRSNKGKLGAG